MLSCYYTASLARFFFFFAFQDNAALTSVSVPVVTSIGGDLKLYVRSVGGRKAVTLQWVALDDLFFV